MKLNTRGGLAAIAIVGATLVAAGCGGSGGDGATGAAKDAAALDFVPRTALGYVTVDTEFSGEGWSQASELATAFDADIKPVDEQVAEAASRGEDGVDFEKDVEPWLGESGGAALLSTGDAKEKAENAETNEAGAEAAAREAEGFAWVEVEDREALEEFAKDQGYTEGDEVEGFTLWSNDDDQTSVAIRDDLAIFAESEEQLTQIVEYDGDSIKDAEGVSDAIDEVEGDALATLVVSGEGARAAAKEDEDLAGLANSEQFEDFQALALAVTAEDEGYRLGGAVKLADDAASENGSFELFDQLPGNTVLALGGHDLGGTVQRTAESAGEGNQQVQQVIGTATAVLGVSLDDLAESLDGEFALALAAEDEGLGSLAGGAVGAAMGGGVEGVDPGQLLRSGTMLLAFEETGDTRETLDKVAGAVGGLTGSQERAREDTLGDFETKQLTVQGVPVTTAGSDDVAAVTLGLDVFEGWGDDGLGDSDTFTAAWEAADGPDESVSRMWVDAGRIARLAGIEGAEDKSVGGMVGWSEADGDVYRIGAFLHIEEQ